MERPECPRCKRPVDSFKIETDPLNKQLRVSITCHGAIIDFAFWYTTLVNMGVSLREAIDVGLRGKLGSVPESARPAELVTEKEIKAGITQGMVKPQRRINLEE